MEVFFIVIAIFAVVFFVIIGVFVKVASTSNNQKANNSNNYSTRYTSSQEKSGGIDLAGEIKAKHPSIAKTQVSLDFRTEADKMIKNKAKEYDTSELHSHPADNGNVKIEKAYTESTAENYTSTEGCLTHYNERTVATKPLPQLNNNAFQNQSEIAKIIILGEIINNPKFKK